MAESPAISLGATLHAALDTLHRPVKASQVSIALDAKDLTPLTPASITEEQIERLVSSSWDSVGYPDQESAQRAFTDACGILKYYCSSSHIPKGQVLGTEVYLSCVTTVRGYRVELSCRVDRLELHADGTLEALDYKASSNGEVPTEQALADDLASFLYFLLVWHHYKHDQRVRNVKLSQLNLLTLTKVEVLYDQHQVIRHRDALTELVSSVRAGGLEPRPNAGCAWCPVRQSCPAWHEVDLDDLVDSCRLPESEEQYIED
jgi:RecB family exonuclease